jgi:hypothetical protein
LAKKPLAAGRKTSAVYGVETKNFRRIFNPFGVAKRSAVIA